MIALLYPKEDYTAADVALKMQALASDHDNRTYIVPRHGRRNERIIGKTLNTATKAILIMHDESALDASTLEDLKVLNANNVGLQAIIPNDLSGSVLSFYTKELLKKHLYQDQNPQELINAAKKSLSREKNSNTDLESELMMGLVGLGLLTLLFMSIPDGERA